MQHRKHIRIFVASPGDVSKERDILDSVVQELNITIAPYKNLSLELVRWETHCKPGLGRPQGVINAQIGPYDIFVGIMWKRFGTPTGQADSGTEEEFEIAHKAWSEDKSLHILFYFCQAPFMPSVEDELDQCRKVLRFRHKLKQVGVFWEYPNHESFGNKIRPHLTMLLLDEVMPSPSASKVEPSFDEMQPMRYFEREK